MPGQFWINTGKSKVPKKPFSTANSGSEFITVKPFDKITLASRAFTRFVHGSYKELETLYRIITITQTPEGLTIITNSTIK
ncbi:hypothetical protein RND71_020732 [Anisodus tanguticus]|uniref:Uncharacterized protein n=1 Tax=Anisodus tanguticus TaxID=243964 RepID=A0AAE1RWX5_9SOLA|nr:hypothetical protein RND71_020732 [Anisodus tanguticus]